jgi:ankyrin repeat protein
VLSPIGIQNRSAVVLEFFLGMAKPGDLDLRDKQGATVLHVAAACEHVAAVQVLLAAGADVNAVNQNGQKPRDLAKGETLRVFEEFVDKD